MTAGTPAIQLFGLGLVPGFGYLLHLFGLFSFSRIVLHPFILSSSFPDWLFRPDYLSFCVFCLNGFV
jgi:hypothetical protein